MDNNTNRLKQNGFTLVEILVVIFILALTVGVVSLKGFDVFGVNTKFAAARLLNVLKVAEFQAIIEGKTLSFTYDLNAYQFLTYDENPDRTTGEWLPIDNNRFLKLYSLPRNVSLSANRHIFFFSSGEITPFTIKVINRGVTQYVITGSENGELSLVEIK